MNEEKNKERNKLKEQQQKTKMLKAIGSNIENIFQKGGNSLKDKFFGKKNELKQAQPIDQKANQNIFPASTKPQLSVAVPSILVSEKKAFTVHLSVDDDKDNIYQVNDDNEDYDEDNEEEEVNDTEGYPETKEEPKKEVAITSQETHVTKKEEIGLTSISQKALVFQERTIMNEKHANINFSLNKERNLDKNSVCHYLYHKGECIDTNNHMIHSFILIKSETKSFLSKIPFNKKNQPKTMEQSYKAIFRDNYLYLLQINPIDLHTPSKLKIESKKNLLRLTQVTMESSSLILKLTFSTDKPSSSTKVSVLKFINRDDLISFAQMIQRFYNNDIKGLN